MSNFEGVSRRVIKQTTTAGVWDKEGPGEWKKGGTGNHRGYGSNDDEQRLGSPAFNH